MTSMLPRLASVRGAVLAAVLCLIAPAAARAQVARPDSARVPGTARDSAPVPFTAADSARIRFMADSIVHARMVADSVARAQAVADSVFRIWSAALATARVKAVADSAARAALPRDTTQPPRSFADTASRFGVDGARLEPGEWRYAITVQADTQTRALGERDVSLARGMYGPMATWLLVATGGRGALRGVDSLYVNALDLQPLHWSSQLGLARVAAAFALDTIFGATDSPLGKQNIVLPKPGRLVVNGEMLDAVLRLEPLAMGWRDSVMLLLTEPTAAVATPAALAVTGEEQVTVPAGAFDCWIVDVQAASGQSRLWVSKTGQIVVRAVQPVPQLGAGAIVERVLVSGPPAPPPPVQPFAPPAVTAPPVGTPVPATAQRP